MLLVIKGAFAYFGVALLFFGAIVKWWPDYEDFLDGFYVLNAVFWPLFIPIYIVMLIFKWVRSKVEEGRR